MKKILGNIWLMFLPMTLYSQSSIDEGQWGCWYMYFWNKSFNTSPWGLQGDIQFRNWNIAGDLEQLMLRGGVTYSPINTESTFTLGYANIRTGAFGDGSSTTGESRIYQEAILAHKVGRRYYLSHRYRYEQRFVDNQDFRTRFRYFLTISVPLNNSEFMTKTWYLVFYNELFINGEQKIGKDRKVSLFDRNRTYLALGYQIGSQIKVQLGIMRQATDIWQKNQLQVSIHHTWK